MKRFILFAIFTALLLALPVIATESEVPKMVYSPKAISVEWVESQLAQVVPMLSTATTAGERLTALQAMRSALSTAPPVNVPSAVIIVMEQLSHSDVAVRRLAVQVLGDLGDKRAADSVADLVNLDDDFEVRRLAADALCSIGGAEYTSVLLHAAESDDPGLRQAAVRALRNTDSDSERVQSLFVELVRSDPYPQVRKEAAASLPGYPDVDVLTELYDSEDDLYTRYSLLIAIGATGSDDALPTIREALETPELINAAVTALGYQDSSSGHRLLRRILDLELADEGNLAAATLVLARFGDDSALDGAEGILNSGTPYHQGDALQALGILGDEDGVEIIADFINGEPRPTVQLISYAHIILGFIGGEVAAEVLLSGFTIEDTDLLYISAAESLVKIGTEKTVEEILELFEDEEVWNDDNAPEILGNVLAELVSEDSTSSLLRSLDRVENSTDRAMIITALGATGSTDALPVLIKWAERSAPASMRESTAALLALGAIGDSSAAPTLAKVLGDVKTPAVRLTAAAQAATLAGDASLLFPLLELLEKGEESESRAAAAAALGELGDARSIDPLERAMAGDPSNLVRNAAFMAYCNLPNLSLEPLLAYLANHDITFDEEAPRRLFHIFDSQNNEQIEFLLREHGEPEVRRFTVVYLAGRYNYGDQELIEGALLNDPNLLVNITAANTLAALGYPSAAAALVIAFKDTFDVYYSARKDWSYSEENVNLLRQTIENAFLLLDVEPDMSIERETPLAAPETSSAVEAGIAETPEQLRV
ncbi:HEAT repeat domain-containing protein, partial [bacterium]|nr:HEAT repeat domain-containing protein [bacterium]